MHFADPPPILPFQIDEFEKTGKARTKTGEKKGGVDEERGKKKSLNETQGKRGRKKKERRKKQFPGQ